MKERQIWDKLLSIAQDPLGFMSKWKQENNKKIIGCLPMYFPEEIIHATGALPVVVPEGEEAITAGHAHMQTYLCGYVRSSLDIGLKGKLSFLDGWVSPDTCHSIRGLANIAATNIKPAFYRGYFFPQVLNSPYAKGYLRSQLESFRADLGQFTGVKITDEALRSSIRVYNRDRELLRNLYSLRRENPGAMTAKRVWAAVASSMFMPKEDHIRLLEELFPALGDNKAGSDSRVRLILSGSLCESAPVGLLDLVEEVGAAVVDDDLYYGSRYVGIDVDPVIDPIEALADRYLNMSPPCPTRCHGAVDWADYLVAMLKRSRAAGIISIMPKYCEPHAMYYPYFKKRMEAAGIPEVTLEIEHGDFPKGQYRTRLEAFLEMIR